MPYEVGTTFLQARLTETRLWLPVDQMAAAALEARTRASQGSGSGTGTGTAGHSSAQNSSQPSSRREGSSEQPATPWAQAAAARAGRWTTGANGGHAGGANGSSAGLADLPKGLALMLEFDALVVGESSNLTVEIQHRETGAHSFGLLPMC
jgi:hypothetical protein